MRGRHHDDVAPVLSSAEADDERLAGVLVTTRRLEPYQVDAARNGADGGTLGERLIAQGSLGEEELARILAAHYGVEEVDFRHTDPAPDAVALLVREQAQALRAVPISADDSGVVVAVVDPSPEHLADLASVMRRPAIPMVTTYSSLDRAIDAAY